MWVEIGLGAPNEHIASADLGVDMKAGTIKWFNNAKGWGFIEVKAEDDVFVHYSQLEGEGYRTLEQGQPVEFELRDGPKGVWAERVRLGPCSPQ